MATLTPTPKMQFLDAEGKPLAGGKLYTYAAGTTTPQATYTTAGGTIANTNPIILDVRGEASVWLDVPYYKFKLTDANDVEVWTADNIGALATLAMLAASGGSDLIGFVQNGAGAVARTVQDKCREEVSFLDFLPSTVVDPTAVDCSAYLQSALNECADGRVLYLNSSIRLDNPVTCPATFGGIRGDGMRKTVITFTREQVNGQTNWQSSCIRLQNGAGVKFSDFTIVYTGTYYVAGQSYFGLVAGLYIVDSDDVLVERVEATDFNYGGVTFYAITRGASNLCKRNKVSHCWLHHNRVAGCLYGFQELFTIEFSVMEYNGDSRDGGTGYGCAAGSGSQNKNIIITGNLTNHNYRKGIDAHDGSGFTITNNRLVGDRIYPISVECDYYPNNSTTIANNVIEVDPSFYVTNDDDQPPGTYSFLICLAVYINPYGSGTAPNSIPNFQITNNQFKNMGCDDSTHTVQGIYVTNNATSAIVTTIADNHFRSNLPVDTCIWVQRGDNGGPVVADIHDNMIRTAALRQRVIAVWPNDVGSLGNRGTANIHDNYIDAPSSASYPINVFSGLNDVHVNNNRIGITTLTTQAIVIETTVNGECDVFMNGNSVSCTSYTVGEVFVYGQNRVFGGQNTLNGDLRTIPNGRLSYLGASSRKFQSQLKSLAATVATPVMRIGEIYVIGTYLVRWSAFRNETGPNAVYMAGGMFTFVAGYSDNSQGAYSTITTLSANDADNGPGTPITITWTIDTVAVSPWLYRLVATAASDCTLYFEVEETAVMQRATSTTNPFI